MPSPPDELAALNEHQPDAAMHRWAVLCPQLEDGRFPARHLASRKAQRIDAMREALDSIEWEDL